MDAFFSTDIAEPPWTPDELPPLLEAGVGAASSDGAGDNGRRHARPGPWPAELGWGNGAGGAWLGRRGRRRPWQRGKGDGDGRRRRGGCLRSFEGDRAKAGGDGGSGRRRRERWWPAGEVVAGRRRSFGRGRAGGDREGAGGTTGTGPGAGAKGEVAWAGGRGGGQWERW
nr:rRNA 2'-O-methyltransferase fibrillarin-like [Aegilops tauschii subsp. strangulata]